LFDAGLNEAVGFFVFGLTILKKRDKFCREWELAPTRV